MDHKIEVRGKTHDGADEKIDAIRKGKFCQRERERERERERCFNRSRDLIRGILIR